MLPDGERKSETNSINREVGEGGGAKLAITDDDDDDEDNDNNVDEETFTTSQVLRSPVFLAFGFADFITAATNTAFFFHLHANFSEDLRLEDETIASIYPLLAVIGISGRIVAGFLTDRYGERFVSIEGELARVGKNNENKKLLHSTVRTTTRQA